MQEPVLTKAPPYGGVGVALTPSPLLSFRSGYTPLSAEHL